MAKATIMLITCLFFMTTTSAQQPKDSSDKKYAGRYGNSSGIVLFEDGTYLLYGYATAVFGTYRSEKGQLLFSTEPQERFEVFAHYNPLLTEGARINFVGFERGSRTFVQLINNSIRPVFNEDANCFSSPFVYFHPEKIHQLTLAVLLPEFSRPNASFHNALSYINTAGYNDFIFVHHVAKRENEDFTGVIVATEKGEVIKLSNYGGTEGYLKHKEGQDESQWKEILDLKRQYEQDKMVKKDIIYANPHYRTFLAPESTKYVYDEKENRYHALEAKENEVRYMQDQYNDPSYLRQYQKLIPKSKHKVNIDTIRPAKSLFFTVCGKGSASSYRYNGFIEYKIPQQQTPTILQPLAPQKPLDRKNRR